jgi:hypothetical protein
LGDSVAKRALDQVGSTRTNGKVALRTIQNMEDDAVSGSDDFNTQVAVLNKINGANVLGLRLNETATELHLNILEQLIVQNKRNRDAEAQMMNAHVFQWRYGQSYAATCSPALPARWTPGVNPERPPCCRPEP